MKKERDYTTVSISNIMSTKIDKALETGLCGNRSDFVRDAVRKLLKEFNIAGV